MSFSISYIAMYNYGFNVTFLRHEIRVSKMSKTLQYNIEL